MPVKRKGGEGERERDASRSGGGRELRWIDWIRELEAAPPSSKFPLGIGDDAAIWVPRKGASVVLTVDVQVESVHFRRGWLTLRDLGRRAVEASVSDLAAMAARPVALLVAIVCEGRTRDRDFRELYRGIHEAARGHRARILGGNLSSGPLAITVTAVGEGRMGRLLRRSGARPGDEVWVTGSPGMARLGLRCLERGTGSPRPGGSAAFRRAVEAGLRAFARPRARVREALEIARAWRPSAMIDLSDGLAADLGHVLDESGRLRGQPLGAELDAEALSSRDGLARLARLLGLPAERAALEGGEDYELLFTVAPRRGAERLAPPFERRFRLEIGPIGRIVERPGICIARADGSRVRASRRGWEHF